MTTPGMWFEPFGDLRPRTIAACPGALAAEGTAGDADEIRVARWDGSLTPSHRVPIPSPEQPISSAWLSLDPTGAELSLAVALGSEMGWDLGVTVFPSLDGAPEPVGRHPEQEDFDFGAPLLLRGDELFLRGADMLYLARRGGGAWEIDPLTEEDDEFEVEEWGWSLSLSQDRLRLAAPCCTLDDASAVAVFARDEVSDPFRLRASFEVPDDPVGMHLLPNGRILAAFFDGLRLYESDGDSWHETAAFTPPQGGAVQSMDAFGSRAVVAQLEQAWALDLAEGTWTKLAEGPRPNVAMMNTAAVVCLGAKFGVFE